MNSDKIIQRIKQAFRDQYSYEKQDLLRRVNAVREYPLVQVYAALDKLVTDSGEHLTDRYGRLGHLVNIEDRYYFQPIELRFKRISMLERSTPIPYKRQSVTVSLPTDVSESALGKAVQGKLEGDEVELPERIEARNLLETSRKDYQRAMGGDGTEDDWFGLCAKLRMGALLEVGQETIGRVVVAHIVEMLMASGKLLLLGYLTSREPEDDFERLLKEYFQRMTMVSKNLQGILLEKGGVQVLYVSRGSGWMEGEPQDYKDMKEQIMKYVVPVSELSLTVGFITGFKGQYMIFKVKDMTLARHKGARCDQAGKTETLKQLNRVLGAERYTRENTKKTVQLELCVLLELSLRLKNLERSAGKRWFLSPEEAVVNRITEIKI